MGGRCFPLQLATVTCGLKGQSYETNCGDNNSHEQLLRAAGGVLTLIKWRIQALFLSNGALGDIAKQRRLHEAG